MPEQDAATRDAPGGRRAMRWLKRLLIVVGWALVLISGWLKGGGEASGELVLALLVAGGLTVFSGHALRERQREPR